MPIKRPKPAKFKRPKKVPNRLKWLRTRHKEEGGFWLTIDEVAMVLGIDASTAMKHEKTGIISPQWIGRYARLYKVLSYEIFLAPPIEDDDITDLED